MEHKVKNIIVVLENGDTKKLEVKEPQISDFIQCNKLGCRIALKKDYSWFEIPYETGFPTPVFRTSIVTESGEVLLKDLPAHYFNGSALIGKDPDSNHLVPFLTGVTKEHEGFAYWDIVEKKAHIRRKDITHATPFEVYPGGLVLAKVYTPFEWRFPPSKVLPTAYHQDFIDLNGNVVISHKSIAPIRDSNGIKEPSAVKLVRE